MSYKVFSTFFFEKKVKKLAQKYRHIKVDLENLIKSLEISSTIGDQIPGCDGPIYKTRMASQDMGKGKSGGFRVIYLVKGSQIFLLTIYPKSERDNIQPIEINNILSKMHFKNHFWASGTKVTLLAFMSI